MPAPLPPNEDLRVEALRVYEILDTAAETILDELTQLAAAICNVPTALISLVDSDRQWFKSRVGIEAEETPREWSFCSYTILEPEALCVVEDATKDERFADNPYVTRDPNIRFYAGAPLVTPEGFALGSLCVVDYKAGMLSETQKASLRLLAKQVMSQFDLRRSLRTNEILTNRYQQIFSESADGICLYDFTGKILSVNQKFCEITGRSEDELLTMRMPDLHSPEDLRLRPIPYEALRRGQTLTYERRLQLPDGTLFTVEKSGKMIDGNTVQAIIRDISDRKAIERELMDARDSALESARTKSAFLTNISHEIRTPLNGLIGMTELLLRTPLDRIQREYGEVIHRSGESLLGIINDLLDLAKIESGTARFEEISFDVRDVVESSLEMLAEGAYRKGIEVATFFEADVPMMMWGDPGRLRQVIMNLTGNAIKFTDHGGVVIGVNVEKQSGDRLELKFTVSDSGIGIAENDLKDLFQPFVQVDDSTTREYGGTGLGLVISKEIVEMMGGEISVDSTPGQGSHFSFTAKFRVVEADDEQGAGLASDAAAKLLRGRRILIVDKSPLILQTIAHYCRDWGMIPTEAVSGNDALAAMRRARKGERFEFVIIDMSLPDWEGFDLAERVRMDDVSDPAKIIVITAHGKRGDAEIAESKGISCYFTKPVCGKQIFECLTALATIEGNADDEHSPALITRHSLRETKLSSGHLPYLKAADYRILLVEDNEVNRRLVLKQLEQVGITADIAKDGIEAIDKIRTGNYRLVLMDCQMPRLDGYQATEEIRRLERQRLKRGEPISPLVIIALTAHSFPGEREKCLNAGMDEYLPKPIKLHKLISLIQQWYPRQNHEFDQKHQRVDGLVPQTEVPEATGEAGRNDLFEVVNEKFAAEIFDLYRSETQKRLDRLTLALADGDADEIARLAHAMRGNALSLGEEATALITERIEDAAARHEPGEIPELLAELTRIHQESLNSAQKGVEIS